MQDFVHQQYLLGSPIFRNSHINIYIFNSVHINLVAEWIHFTLFGIILPTMKLKVYTFGVGLMNSGTQELRKGERL